jgi:hypothetical protein
MITKKYLEMAKKAGEESDKERIRKEIQLIKRIRQRQADELLEAYNNTLDSEDYELD